MWNQAAAGDLAPLPVNVVRAEDPSPRTSPAPSRSSPRQKKPIVLAGHGAARAGAKDALVAFSESLGLRVATTFHGKGIFPDAHENALGTVGFMTHDYVNFGFDEADTIIAVGYELQEFDPERINPKGDKKIIHIHRFPAEVDAHYDVSVGVQGDIPKSLEALSSAVDRRFDPRLSDQRIRNLLKEEIDRGDDDSFPARPQRLVSDTRAALGDSDVVLADTGAVKMWMARLTRPTRRIPA